MDKLWWLCKAQHQPLSWPNRHIWFAICVVEEGRTPCFAIAGLLTDGMHAGEGGVIVQTPTLVFCPKYPKKDLLTHVHFM